MKTVNLNEIRDVFKKAMQGDHLVHVIYRREMPKCEACGTRYKFDVPPLCTKMVATLDASGNPVIDEYGNPVKHVCNHELSYVTTDTCRFGVQNPGAGITKPGEGAREGVSAVEAFGQGYVKYYSFTREGDRVDGKKGGYRQFKLDNLIEATVEGEKYLVNHK